jgi:dienelactone hydrolase
MRVVKFVSVFVVSVIILAGCGSGEQKPKKAVVRKESKSVLFSPGKIYDKVRCAEDTAFSYALYLPQNYSRNSVYPVIFFFDAHKRGKLPVKTYRLLADKYNYILAGSNNSTNGQSAQEMKKAVDIMMDDVKARFRVDDGRVYTSGFSGGARVASGVALFNGGVKGVIGCAAGFPQIQSQPKSSFAYIGIVGNEDFNYLEMKDVDNMLDSWETYNYLLIYNGKHDWPPANVMEQGFMFMEFDAMRNGLLPVDNGAISDFKQINDSVRYAARQKQDWYGLYEANLKATVFLQGLDDLEEYKNEVSRLVKKPHFIVQQDKEMQLEKKESKLQQQYIQAMTTQGKNRWKKEINELIRLSKNAETEGERLMSRRLMNYLSLISFFSAKNALKQKQAGAADKFLMIYEMVDPDNPEVYFLKASYYMMMKNIDAAIAQLQKAADKGFKEPERLKNSKTFKPVSNRKEFRKIIEEVERNKESAD